MYDKSLAQSFRAVVFDSGGQYQTWWPLAVAKSKPVALRYGWKVPGLPGKKGNHQQNIWLVVSNICLFPFHTWDNPSHWLIFFKMAKTTNQNIIGNVSSVLVISQLYCCYFQWSPIGLVISQQLLEVPGIYPSTGWQFQAFPRLVPTKQLDSSMRLFPRWIKTWFSSNKLMGP